jgi:beta-xylosidase
MKIGVLTALISFALAGPAFAQQASPPAPKLSWGDQGNGTFKNPILKADFSDPDVVRVGKDFYLIASDFHYVGMQILHSVDLVNWTPVGQVFSKLSMNAKYDQMAGYGEGTWAPSLRYHSGEFFIYVCTPHDGLFMWHAKNAAGPWSETVTVKAVDGWEDPCPFWDDDGQGYLVHSRTGAGPLILHKLSSDGESLLDEGKEIYRGNVAEGPKMFKRHGYYYISLPEGGVTVGGQVVLRSKDLYGPYERKQVLEDGSPHQGGMVELDSGEAWFIGFKSSDWLGRVCHLEPVVWGADEWPTFGDGGKHVVQAKKPNVGAVTAPSRPEVDDDFGGRSLNLLWQWNHNPVEGSWSLVKDSAGGDGAGALWLKAAPLVEPPVVAGRAPTPAGVARARNTLTQKLWDDYGVVDVQLFTSLFADGQVGGLTFECGRSFAWAGVGLEGGKRRIRAVFPAAPTPRGANGGGGGAATAPAPFEGPKAPQAVVLRAIYEKNHARFAYSLDGATFTDVPGSTTLRFIDWKGARIGLFTYGPLGEAADFRRFRYRYFSTPEELAAVLGKAGPLQ